MRLCFYGLKRCCITNKRLKSAIQAEVFYRIKHFKHKF